MRSTVDLLAVADPVRRQTMSFPGVARKCSLLAILLLHVCARDLKKAKWKLQSKVDSRNQLQANRSVQRDVSVAPALWRVVPEAL